MVPPEVFRLRKMFAHGAVRGNPQQAHRPLFSLVKTCLLCRALHAGRTCRHEGFPAGVRHSRTLGNFLSETEHLGPEVFRLRRMFAHGAVRRNP